NQFDSAELYLNDALKLFELQNHLLGTALALNNLGLVYKNQKLYKKAKNYYLRSLEISKTLEGRNEDLVNVFYNLGNIALAENEYYLAEKYAKEAEKIATDNNLLPSLKESLELLAKTAELKKDY